jgi:serine/threonine-protein kinase
MNSRFAERDPEFSPDGRWMAYVSDESGRPEVYVRPFPATRGKKQISNEGGTEPLWTRNGKQLFYRRPPQRQVWAVDVQSGSGFAVTKTRLLFTKAGYESAPMIRYWDVSPGRRRFLMVKQEDRKPQPITEMILVHDWLEELKQLAPIGKK